MASRTVVISNGLVYTWAGDRCVLPAGKHDILKPGLFPKGVERVVAETLKAKYGVETPAPAQVRVEQETVKEEAFTAPEPVVEDVPATAPEPPVVVAEVKPAHKPRRTKK